MNALRNALRHSPLLFDRAKALSRVLGNRTELYSCLAKHIPRQKHISFIQIGAADGLLHDPYREFILRKNLHGVLVEPLPAQFKRLQRNYRRKKGVSFANCAVSYPPSDQAMSSSARWTGCGAPSCTKVACTARRRQ